MTRQLRWTEQAVDQLGAIADYLSQTSPVYAEGLITRVSTQLHRLLEFPDIGRVVPEAASPILREVIEWPYRIIYRPRTETIEVLAVVHVRRDLRAVPLT